LCEQEVEKAEQDDLVATDPVLVDHGWKQARREAVQMTETFGHHVGDALFLGVFA